MKFLLTIFLYVIFANVFAQNNREVPFTQEDRDRIIRTEAKVDALEKRMDKSDAMIQKQFDGIQKQFDGIQKQFDDIRTFLYWGFGILFSFMAFLLGFILWDRRTYIKPVEQRLKSIELEFENYKTESKKIENLVLSLRQLAKTDTNIAIVLKQFNLL